MDAMILAFNFAAALAISAGIVLAFSTSIDQVLSRLIPEDIAPAWCRYVKFALFTASFAGGMRLTEIAALVAQWQAPVNRPPITAGQSLLEVYRTIVGTLVGASETLLVFFVSTLAAYAAMHAYKSFQSHRSSPQPPRPVERAAAQTERPTSMAGRHSSAPASTPPPPRER